MYECVCEWVNVIISVKRLHFVNRTEINLALKLDYALLLSHQQREKPSHDLRPRVTCETSVVRDSPGNDLF